MRMDVFRTVKLGVKVFKSERFQRWRIAGYLIQDCKFFHLQCKDCYMNN